MEVIYYQIFIAATIVVAYFFKREAILYVCGFWTLFSLANLYSPALIFVQLAVIWGTYFLLKKNASKNKKINELQKTIEALPAEQRKRVDAVSSDFKRLLSGVEHYTFMLENVHSATKSVTILSGWISERVIDKKFLSLLQAKAKDGVRFRIGYGWQNSQGNHNDSDDSRKAFQALERLAGKYPNKIQVAEFATHEKTLVIDGRIVIFGSANWLSNRKYKNSERSIVVEDGALAKSENKRIGALIGRYRVI